MVPPFMAPLATVEQGRGAGAVRLAAVLSNCAGL